jgi:hypothetical protein
MVTAVALPQILATPGRLDGPAQGLVDHQRLPAGLRRDDASGGPPDGPVGRAPALPGGLAVFTLGSLLAGLAQTGSADRGAARPGGRRRRDHPGGHGRRLASVRGPGPPAGAGHHRRADVPGHGRRAVRRRRGPRDVHPETALANMGISGRAARVHRGARPGAGSSTSTSRSASAPWSSPGPPARVGTRRASPPGWTCWGAASSPWRSASILPGPRSSATDEVFGVPTNVAVGGLIGGGLVAGVLAIWHGLRRPLPFLDPRLFADRVFSSAALISLLTGYGMATAIVGGAVFVDRVLYGGPEEQRVVLGRSPGRWPSGRSPRASWPGGLAAADDDRRAGAREPAAWPGCPPGNPDAGDPRLRGRRGGLRLGFGLTVTPRSTAAVEAAGKAAFGAASATVTVARMIGMAVGMAALTAYGSTTITRISNEIYGSGDSLQAVHPGVPARSAAQRRPGCPGAGAVGGEQGRVDPGRHLPRRGVGYSGGAAPALLLRVRPGRERGVDEAANEEIEHGEIAF